MFSIFLFSLFSFTEIGTQTIFIFWQILNYTIKKIDILYFVVNDVDNLKVKITHINSSTRLSQMGDIFFDSAHDMLHWQIKKKHVDKQQLLNCTIKKLTYCILSLMMFSTWRWKSLTVTVPLVLPKWETYFLTQCMTCCTDKKTCRQTTTIELHY